MPATDTPTHIGPDNKRLLGYISIVRDVPNPDHDGWVTSLMVTACQKGGLLLPCTGIKEKVEGVKDSEEKYEVPIAVALDLIDKIGFTSLSGYWRDELGSKVVENEYFYFPKSAVREMEDFKRPVIKEWAHQDGTEGDPRK